MTPVSPEPGPPPQEVSVHWNSSIRRLHRWVSIIFTVTVIANFAAMALGSGMPPPWITYAPLLPLAVLLFSGLYLFALPYTGARRTGTLRTGRSE